jgi:predicted nuclease of predicted toxin-antitoxin system
MNLSPSWVAVFRQENWEAVHWSSVGSATASDSEILGWAAENDYVVFTRDLDFGVLLASRLRHKPSVIQLRTQETSPSLTGPTVVLALKRLENELQEGALVTIDPARARVRLLPLR